MTEVTGDHRPVGIELSDPFGANNPLIELVAEYWPQIKAVFGDSVEARLTHLRSHGLWEGLCNAGVEHTDLARDAANAIRHDNNLALQPSALRFIARLRPRSLELREVCVSALQGSVRFDAFDSVRASVDILAEQFRDDPELVTIVEARYGVTLRHEGAALAICAVAAAECSGDGALYRTQRARATADAFRCALRGALCDDAGSRDIASYCARRQYAATPCLALHVETTAPPSPRRRGRSGAYRSGASRRSICI